MATTGPAPETQLDAPGEPLAAPDVWEAAGTDRGGGFGSTPPVAPAGLEEEEEEEEEEGEEEPIVETAGTATVGWERMWLKSSRCSLSRSPIDLRTSAAM